MKLFTQLAFVLAMTFLMAGCVKGPEIYGSTSRGIGFDFTVDGSLYSCLGNILCVKSKERLLLYNTNIIIYPEDQKRKYEPNVMVDKLDSWTDIGFVSSCSIQVVDPNDFSLSVRPDSIHFVDNNRVVFSKTNEELGIDTTDHQKAFSEENLKPILEKMIRENKLNATEE